MYDRLLVVISMMLALSSSVAATAAGPHAYDDSLNSNSPNYGWKFAKEPEILEGFWTENGGFRLEVKPMWANLEGRICNRRHILLRDGTYMMVCEENDPTYGPRLWGIYMRPWQGERWQFATSRPAPSLEALTSGNPDERTWYTYDKSAKAVAAPPPVSVDVSTPTKPTPPPPQNQGDATFTKEQLESFKVDNTIQQPPDAPNVWWISPHRNFERREGGQAEGEPLYICRTKVKGQWVTGSVKKRNGSWCRVVVKDKERKRIPYETLLKRKGDAESLFWAPMKGADPGIRANMRRMAFGTGGTSICTVPVAEDEQRPGHLTGEGCAYGVDGEAKLEREDYWLLIKPPQHLADQWNKERG